MRIRIDKIVYPGRRMGLLDGKVVFTDLGLPGETVEVEITRDKKSYAEARTIAVVETSPARVEPRCAHYVACSPYQDMDYGLELEVKKGQVAEIMARELRLSFESLSVTPSPGTWGYRNKIRLRVLREGAGGAGGAARFVYNEPGEPASFVTVDRCHLVPDRVNDLLARLRGIVDDGPFASVEAIEVRTSRARGESLAVVDLSSGGEAEALGAALAPVKREFGLVGAVASVYDGKRWRDERLFGREFVEEVVGGLTFRIGARSFFQANVGILERVFDDIAAAAGPWAGETVADLYCGLGTFGILLARKAREVFGVESDAREHRAAEEEPGPQRHREFRRVRRDDRGVAGRGPGQDAGGRRPRSAAEGRRSGGRGRARRRPRAARALPLVQSDDPGARPEGARPGLRYQRPSRLRLLPAHAAHRDPGRARPPRSRPHLLIRGHNTIFRINIPGRSIYR